MNAVSSTKSMAGWFATTRRDAHVVGYREYWRDGHRIGCIKPENNGWRWISLCGLIADGFEPYEADARQRVETRSDLQQLKKLGGLLTEVSEAEGITGKAFSTANK